MESSILIGSCSRGDLDPDGRLLLHHRKIHELDFGRELYDTGDRLGVADTPFGRIGLMICADGFAPGQVITRSLALRSSQQRRRPDLGLTNGASLAHLFDRRPAD
jgi:predicted amidohydrolase